MWLRWPVLGDVGGPVPVSVVSLFRVFGRPRTTYESLPIGCNLHQQLCSANLHIRIVHHVADLGHKLPDVSCALHFEYSVKAILLHQVVVEVAERFHNVIVGFKDHDDFADLVFVALHELQVFRSVRLTLLSLYPVTIATDGS
jgi:hypothetical protein